MGCTMNLKLTTWTRFIEYMIQTSKNKESLDYLPPDTMNVPVRVNQYQFMQAERANQYKTQKLHQYK